MNRRQEINNRYALLQKIVKEFKGIDFNQKATKSNYLDNKTKWIFQSMNGIEFIKKNVKGYSKNEIDYAIRRAYNYIASEMVEHVIVFSIPQCVKLDKYDKYGDVMIDGIKYDVKLVADDWSGKLYRNYNSKYITVKYVEKTDFLNKEFLHSIKDRAGLVLYQGQDVHL